MTARSSDEEPGGPRTVPLTADRLAATLDDLRRVSKEDGNVKFVRLTISDDMPSSELIDINTHSFGSKSAFTVTRLLFERYEIPTSCSDLQKLYYEVCEKAKDTVAESLAQQIDSLAWEPLTGKWVTRDPGNLGSTAQQVASFQDAAHRLLLGQPIKDLVVRLDPGLPGTSGLEFVIDQVPVDNIDDPLGSLKRAIEITGIVVGAMSGNPPLMLTSAKMLVHDEFHHALAESIKRFLFGSGQEKNPRHSDKVSFAHGERYVEPPAFLPELGGWGMHGRGWG